MSDYDQALKRLCVSAFSPHLSIRSVDGYDRLSVISRAMAIEAMSRVLPDLTPDDAAICIMYSVTNEYFGDDKARLAKEVGQLRSAYDGRYSREELHKYATEFMRHFAAKCGVTNDLSERHSWAKNGDKVAAAIAVFDAIRSIAPKTDN